MKRPGMYLLGICVLFSALILNCQTKTIELFNGQDFTGWEFVLTDNTANPDTVWTINDGIIRCNGIPNGYMRTEAEYENYTLYLDWRWVEKEGNSGVLLHTQVPDNVWPVCVECQLRSRSAGDFIMMKCGSLTVDGKDYSSTDRFVIIQKKQEGIEKPVGEWNSYKIVCNGDEISCYVNGVLQNKGTGSSLTRGKICLQSEGAPIEFRNIRLEMLK